jgi:Ser/Thr protein kinase RdoA (MazF antagonist)
VARVPNHVIHADLHGYNLLRHYKSIRVIDFDDMAIGSAVQDIAVAAYYHEDSKKFINALLDGYSSIAEPPHFTDEEINALLVQRNLVLLNDLFTTASAELSEILPEYAPKTARRMIRYLETGNFSVAE